MKAACCVLAAGLCGAIPASLQPMGVEEEGAASFMEVGATTEVRATTHAKAKQSVFRVPLRKVRRSQTEEKEYFSSLHQHHLDLRHKTHKSRLTHHTQHQSIYKIKLTDINNSQFVGDITVGEPGQPFRVIFDTGSSNLWINGDGCTDEACMMHRRFHPDDSGTFTLLDTDMDVTFGTGQITGSLATDTFGLGPNLSVHGQTFGMIKRETGSVFKSGEFDGILGLSFPALSAASYTPVFDNIMSQQLLDENTFSFLYGRNEGVDSAVMFGIPPPDVYKGEMHFVGVSKAVYWELALTDIYYGDKPMGVCPDQPCKLVVDTGTSLLTGPKEHMRELMQVVENEQQKIGFSCSHKDLSSLPSITYVLEDVNENGQRQVHNFTLEPEYYMLNSAQESTCKPGLMGLDVGAPRGPLWILGDVFMLKFFTVFSRNADGKTGRVGFAPVANPAKKSDMATSEQPLDVFI